MSRGPEWFARLNEEYRRRRVLAGEIFDLVGAEYDPESTGMFLWGKVNGKGIDVSDRLGSDCLTPPLTFRLILN